jgi:hypothetical protein
MITKFVPSQTSVPDWVMSYCRQISDVHYGRKLNRMYIHLLNGFLTYEPWNASPPFAWRYAKIHRTSGARVSQGGDLGWVPMNMLLPNELYDRIRHVIDVVNTNGSTSHRQLSMRTLLYTAICWWCSAVYPYTGPGMISQITE